MYISKDLNKRTPEFMSFIKRNLKELNEVRNKGWEFIEYKYVDDGDKPGIVERTTLKNRATGTVYKIWYYHNDSGHTFRKVEV